MMQQDKGDSPRNILIVGGGGREHALAWKAAQSPRVGRVWVAPGNAGTAREPKTENVDIDATDLDRLVAFARDRAVDLTIVGPEAPLVAGITDAFTEAGLACFGPGRDGARLEGSKAYTKAFLARHHIPTASYAEFDALAPALDYVRNQSLPVVIKADGLAAGKGVIIARQPAEAEQALRDMLEEKRFGAAGQRVVVESFLEGEEASFMAIVDGTRVLALASSQDHKARDDGDRGPNTGGMGAYSPAPVVTAQMHERILREVIRPTVEGLAAEGVHYRGFLYAGLMIAPDGTPNVLEYNCRLGDPEAQPILMRLRSDLVELCEAALRGTLDTAHLEWDPRTAVGVVLAAEGYPGDYRKGDVIRGLPERDAPDLKVFHAGTRLEGGEVVTSGGRVLCVCALGEDVGAARERAYALAERIEWPGRFFRRDIAYRALARRAG